MSRGFNLKEAQKLLVRANFNKILESIKNEKLRDLILQQIDLEYLMEQLGMKWVLVVEL